MEKNGTSMLHLQLSGKNVRQYKLRRTNVSTISNPNVRIIIRTMHDVRMCRVLDALARHLRSESVHTAESFHFAATAHATLQ